MNAKKEFLEFIADKAKVAAAKITLWFYTEDDVFLKSKTTLLKKSYSDSEWETFLKSLILQEEEEDFIVHPTGTIWFADGSWAKMEEDHAWIRWIHYVLPEIPQELIKEEA